MSFPRLSPQAFASHRLQGPARKTSSQLLVKNLPRMLFLPALGRTVRQCATLIHQGYDLTESGSPASAEESDRAPSIHPLQMYPPGAGHDFIYHPSTYTNNAAPGNSCPFPGPGPSMHSGSAPGPYSYGYGYSYGYPPADAPPGFACAGSGASGPHAPSFAPLTLAAGPTCTSLGPRPAPPVDPPTWTHALSLGLSPAAHAHHAYYARPLLSPIRITASSPLDPPLASASTLLPGTDPDPGSSLSLGLFSSPLPGPRPGQANVQGSPSPLEIIDRLVSEGPAALFSPIAAACAGAQEDLHPEPGGGPRHEERCPRLAERALFADPLDDRLFESPDATKSVAAAERVDGAEAATPAAQEQAAASDMDPGSASPRAFSIARAKRTRPGALASHSNSRPVAAYASDFVSPPVAGPVPSLWAPGRPAKGANERRRGRSTAPSPCLPPVSVPPRTRTEDDAEDLTKYPPLPPFFISRSRALPSEPLALPPVPAHRGRGRGFRPFHEASQSQPMDPISGPRPGSLTAASPHGSLLGGPLPKDADTAVRGSRKRGRQDVLAASESAENGNEVGRQVQKHGPGPAAVVDEEAEPGIDADASGEPTGVLPLPPRSPAPLKKRKTSAPAAPVTAPQGPRSLSLSGSPPAPVTAEKKKPAAGAKAAPRSGAGAGAGAGAGVGAGGVSQAGGAGEAVRTGGSSAGTGPGRGRAPGAAARPEDVPLDLRALPREVAAADKPSWSKWKGRQKKGGLGFFGVTQNKKRFQARLLGETIGCTFASAADAGLAFDRAAAARLGVDGAIAWGVNDEERVREWGRQAEQLVLQAQGPGALPEAQLQRAPASPAPAAGAADQLAMEAGEARAQPRDLNGHEQSS